MKFTESEDGQARATFRLSIRLTAEEVETAKRLAREDGESLREWLTFKAALGVEEALIETGGEMEPPP